MTEIAVQQASRLIRRKLSDAIGKSLLKTLTEPITNSDDSYGEIVRSESGNENAVFPITIFVDKEKRLVKVVDCAQGMTASELKSKFKEYGAEKSSAYKGGNSRGIFGQGLSDVLFYHKDGKIKSIKNGEASVCSFYWKRDKQYINIEHIKSSVSKLSKEERERGLIASSAGNHAQGVAYAAQLLGAKATIVMPKTTPLIKVEATKNFGATVVLHGSNYDDAFAKAKELQEENGYVFIHPFDNKDVIEGQGTISLEILEELEDVDIIMVPIGGGGLIAGIAYAAKQINLVAVTPKQ